MRNFDNSHEVLRLANAPEALVFRRLEVVHSGLGYIADAVGQRAEIPQQPPSYEDNLPAPDQTNPVPELDVANAGRTAKFSAPTTADYERWRQAPSDPYGDVN